MSGYSADYLASRFCMAYRMVARGGITNTEPIEIDDAIGRAREALESGGEVVCIEPALAAFIATPDPEGGEA